MTSGGMKIIIILCMIIVNVPVKNRVIKMKTCFTILVHQVPTMTILSSLQIQTLLYHN